MKRDEYIKEFEATLTKMLHTTQKKNADYAGAGDDAFANFKQIGHLLQDIHMVNVGILTRMSDKMSRIASFIQNGDLQVKEESAGDTLLDLAVYAIIFKIKLQHDKK